ncbi:hypothetical protein C8R43DRAFT_953810 [Mycena crocata]|nr:hypothetical protein C8R43DRAFT_953810 [Mycena crocata]
MDRYGDRKTEEEKGTKARTTEAIFFRGNQEEIERARNGRMDTGYGIRGAASIQMDPFHPYPYPYSTPPCVGAGGAAQPIRGRVKRAWTWKHPRVHYLECRVQSRYRVTENGKENENVNENEFEGWKERDENQESRMAAQNRYVATSDANASPHAWSRTRVDISAADPERITAHVSPPRRLLSAADKICTHTSAPQTTGTDTKDHRHRYERRRRTSTTEWKKAADEAEVGQPTRQKLGRIGAIQSGEKRKRHRHRHGGVEVRLVETGEVEGEARELEGEAREVGERKSTYKISSIGIRLRLRMPISVLNDYCRMKRLIGHHFCYFSEIALSPSFNSI